MLTTSFPLARYRLDFTVETLLTLPAFAGSTLRGAFGGALRAGACITRQPTCDNCQLLANCSYATVFEPRPPNANHPLQNFNQIPRPYVIEPPEWGEKSYKPGDILSFHVVLAGRTINQLPLILWAFRQALLHGVGKGEGKANLAQVWHVTESRATLIVDGPDNSIAPHDAVIQSHSSTATDSICLRFVAPLRLQTNGRRATAEEFTPRKLLTSLIRRIALMHEFHGAGPLTLDFKTLAAQAGDLVSEKQLRWRDWSRHSSRQQKRIDLGGVMGTWTLRGDLSPFLPFLHLGQWLHVGKETAFGLGAYTVEYPA